MMNIQKKYFRFLIIFFVLFSFSQTFSQKNEKICKTRIAEIINSYQPTIIPVLNIDGTELFYDRKIHPQNTNGIKDKDEIWYSVKGTGNSWGEPLNFGKPINTFDSDVLFSISPDGSKYLVYGLYAADGKQKTPGFSLTKKVFGKWDSPVPLNIKNYYNDSSNFYANLSADGRVLIMALHRKDSRGNLDLYVSFLMDSCCTFSEPVNLGEVINTSNIEGSPFLAYDNKSLYFSSNGHKGFGKQDLFVSRRLDDSWLRWSPPVNLGKQINTPDDDNGIWLTALGDTAYIVSTDTLTQREGICFVCLPDSLQPKPYIIIAGKLFSVNGGHVSLMKESVRFEANNDVTRSIDYFYSNQDKSVFYYVLPSERQYNLMVSSPGYEDFSFSVNSFDLNKTRFSYYDVVLHPKKLGELLETVYFETNLDALKPEDKARLSYIVNKVFDTKDVKLLITGHTDEVGGDEENYGLSLRRANNVADFLQDFGFRKANMKIVGKGKSQPKSSNHEENRRVEVYVED